MPRRKQRKRFEALHKARWTARTGSSTAATSIPSTRSIIAEDNDRNEVGSLAPPHFQAIHSKTYY